MLQSKHFSSCTFQFQTLLMHSVSKETHLHNSSIIQSIVSKLSFVHVLHVFYSVKSRHSVVFYKHLKSTLVWLIIMFHYYSKHSIHEKLMQLIIFKLAGEEYGLSIDQIKEVVLTPRVAKMPQTPAYIKGVANIRGNIIAIMDLEQKFLDAHLHSEL